MTLQFLNKYLNKFPSLYYNKNIEFNSKLGGNI